MDLGADRLGVVFEFFGGDPDRDHVVSINLMEGNLSREALAESVLPIADGAQG